MTTEEKFNAAVNVIRSLPKNGSYQPSNELMLRFYAYYKQATEGPCSEAKTSKPAFWDVVGRAKHTAWARLKDMSREEAMKRYVNELHNIVETMSYTDNVANFMQAGDQEVLNSLPLNDLELIAGDCLEYVRSQPGSPLPSRPSTPDPRANNVTPPIGGEQPDDDEDDEEEYIDTMENDPDNIQRNDVDIQQNIKTYHQQPQQQLSNGNGISVANNNNNHTTPSVVMNGVATREQSTITTRQQETTKQQQSKIAMVDISGEVARTIASLQSDIRSLDTRVTVLEQATKSSSRALHQSNRRITIYHLSPALIAFLLIWPFVAIRLTRRFTKQQ